MTTMTIGAGERPQMELWRTIVSILTAGAFATIAFDLFGQSISPMLGYPALAPVGLANGVLNSVFGWGWRPLAEGMHLFTGLIAYPLGWVLVAEPLRRKLAPWFPWLGAAVVYGIVLWVFALYFMAHLVAGNAPFLGFSGITWVALWGHILFAVVAAAVANARQE